MSRMPATIPVVDAERVMEIIGVIDGIAFQANILALNAAVESTRAGEGGQGYAVVSREARSLAKRCTGAAQQIEALIAGKERPNGNHET